jgi:hypothetical protein
MNHPGEEDETLRGQNEQPAVIKQTSESNLVLLREDKDNWAVGVIVAVVIVLCAE